MKLLSAALASIGRRFIGNETTKRNKYLYSSAYYKPNGDREVRRRLRQEIKALAKRSIELLPQPDGTVIPETLWEQMNYDGKYSQKFKRATRKQLLEIRNQIKEDLGLVEVMVPELGEN